MSLYTLFDTPFARANDIDGKARQALPFLIKNAPYVICTPQQVNELAQSKLYSSTPLNKIYMDICNAGKLNNFILVNLSQVGESEIPLVFTYDLAAIDGKMIPGAPVPAQLQKCWINITPILSAKDSYNGQLILTDVSAFANRIVLSALVSGYDDAVDMWLYHKYALTVVETYATMFGHVCRQQYNLAYEEQKFVETLFACYMAQLLGPRDGDLRVPPLLARCTFLGSAQDIMGRIASVDAYRPEQGNSIMRPPVIVNCIVNAGPPRMHNFNIAQLYRSISSYSLDSALMLYSVDFPPYWVYQMIRAVSGYKNPLISTIMRLNTRMKNNLTDFANDLQASGVIVAGLNRR